LDVKDLLETIHTSPSSVEFNEVMAVIADHYVYTPSAFKNGGLENRSDQNQGSAKILAFAQLNGLTELQTLACFGSYYRDDVLGHPEGQDHGNIRNFMKHGWGGVVLPDTVLVAK